MQFEVSETSVYYLRMMMIVLVLEISDQFSYVTSSATIPTRWHLVDCSSRIKVTGHSVVSVRIVRRKVTTCSSSCMDGCNTHSCIIHANKPIETNTKHTTSQARPQGLRGVQRRHWLISIVN